MTTNPDHITMIGIDPGIVDTALVSITMDRYEKCFLVWSRTWTGVSRQVKENFVIKQSFLDELTDEVTKIKRNKGRKVTAVEGYRNRGNNMRQDQQMSKMVEAISKAVKGSTIVDNTGVKNVVKPALMAAFNFQFASTHHRDLESAARIAIKLALQDEAMNEIISDFTLAHIMSTPWRRV